MKIFVQKQDSKFINNIILTLRYMEESVLSTTINRDLYKIYHHFPFEIGVFLSSEFNNETAQFITELSPKGVRCFIYHDQLNTDILNDFGKITTNFTYTEQPNSVHIPSMVNSHLYKKMDLPRKKSSYAVFLDHDKDIPDDLLDVLYPNKKLHINMFNSEYVSHPQNLGLLSEIDKAHILNTYEFFIDVHNNYASEAICCGAKPITIDQIKNNKKPRLGKNSRTTKITYESFIRTHLI